MSFDIPDPAKPIFICDVKWYMEMDREEMKEANWIVMGKDWDDYINEWHAGYEVDVVTGRVLNR